jgi:tetratricopeptide (TPR) repeat protein
MGLAMAPAILRNLVVGAPALAMNGSATGMLALYHIGSATPFDLLVSPEMSRVLVAADGGLLSSLAEAAKTHASPWSFWLLEARKLLYAWHGFEAPNNVDFYIFRQGAPLLAALPVTFVVLLPLAAVGVASRRAAEAWPVLVAIAASVPALVLGAVLSRYRAPLTAALLPLAGAGVVRLAGWIADRRWAWVGATGAATALYLVWATGSPPGKEPPELARFYARRGAEALVKAEPALAALFLQESLRLEPGAATVEARLGQILLQTGDAAGAVRHLARAARSLDSAPFHELYARALARAGRREEAIAQARAAVAADPSEARRRALLARLEQEAAAAGRPAQEKP